MKFTKNNKKNDRPRVTVTAIDVLIVIALAVLAVFAVRYVFSDGTGDEAYEVSYVLKISEVRDELADKLASGDMLYLFENGECVGTVVAREVTVAVREKTGQLVQGRSDIYVTVEVMSSEPESVNVSGTEIFVEGEYSMRSTDFSFECVCISVGK